ncbi:MAG: Holliday junction branch migration protein RuvA [Bacteroidales bacterium]|nr:Holliday junction branch migration protein RuvA [Bacteroidales bacterium]
MYEYIKGSLVEITPTEAIVEAAGIGWRLLISLQTYDKLRSMKEVKVYAYHHLREDDEALYGFYDREERRLFELLIGVSGVGAGTARLVLSALSSEEFTAAIVAGDVAKIKAVKGIGLKTAQKIIIELKDKVSKEKGAEISLAGSASNASRGSAVTALVMLGFAKAASEKAVDQVLKADPALEIEDIIKKSLKLL